MYKQTTLNIYNTNLRTPVFIDLSNILYRSLYVFTPDKFKTSQGIPTGHLFGVCQVIKTLLSLGYEVYFCKDSKCDFRKELNENYKANRTPNENSKLIQNIQNVLLDLIYPLENVHLLMAEGQEADDVMYSAAKLCSAHNIKCYIMTADKDLVQAVDSNITVTPKFTLDGPQDIIIEGNELYNKHFEGVKPKYISIYRAFRGDPSDNLEAPIKRFPKDLIFNLIDDFDKLESKNILEVIKNHKCVKKSHENWIKKLLLEENLNKFVSNVLIMKLKPVDFAELMNLNSNYEAYNKVVEQYELWGYNKFVQEYNKKGDNDGR